MTEIIDQARQLIESSQISSRHTFYQLKHFVLGKEVTTQSKLQKCLREIDARYSSIKSMIVGLDDMEDEIKILDLKIAILDKKKAKNELHKEYKSIQKRKLNRKKVALFDSIKETKNKVKETEEEMSFFIGAYKQLEKIEPLKRHDDPEANAQFWNENFAQELQLRILLQKPLDTELVKCILALDPESTTRKEMISILEQVQARAMITQRQNALQTNEVVNG